jgi:hypothetical protein
MTSIPKKKIDDSYICHGPLSDDEGPYVGKFCLCAGCRHVDGVCVDHDSGGGCSVCEGPINECDVGASEE